MLLLRRLVKSVWWSIGNNSGESAIPADAYRNVITSSNAISVFEIKDEGDIETIETVVTAGAVTRDFIQNADYCIFSDSLLDGLGIRIWKTPGDTPVSGVNSLHYEVQGFTAKSLYSFVCRAAGDGALDRVHKNKVEEIIRRLLDNRDIQADKLNDKMRESLGI